MAINIQIFSQKFCTTTVIMNSISNSDTSCASMLTAHAAGHFLKRASSLSVCHNENANRPLLGELNISGYNQIKQLVHKTFHNVSTYSYLPRRLISDYCRVLLINCWCYLVNSNVLNINT